jgi:hypothetical protein
VGRESVRREREKGKGKGKKCERERERTLKEVNGRGEESKEAFIISHFFFPLFSFLSLPPLISLFFCFFAPLLPTFRFYFPFSLSFSLSFLLV